MIFIDFLFLQRPAYGGKYCSGPSDDCRVCDLPMCLTSIDLRAQQCTKLANILYLERFDSTSDVTWLPHASNQENLRCRLVCRSKETDEIFYTRKHLIDGTPCSYGSTDICIQVRQSIWGFLISFNSFILFYFYILSFLFFFFIDKIRRFIKSIFFYSLNYCNFGEMWQGSNSGLVLLFSELNFHQWSF